MKQSVTQAAERRKHAEPLCAQAVSFISTCDNYRLPNTSLPEFIQHGAGAFGVYFLFDKTTGIPRSVRLLSVAAVDKNCYYFSAIVDGIKGFALESGTDFFLQDGICLCLMAKYTANFEPLLCALFSEELRRQWPRRSSYPGGVIGLIVSLMREWLGGLNFGTSHTRRFQPHQASDIAVQDVQRIVEGLTKLCTRSHVHKVIASEKEYENRLNQIQDLFDNISARDAKRARKTNLTTQQCLHLLIDCGFLNAPGLSTFAIMCRGGKKNDGELRDIDFVSLRLYLKVVMQAEFDHSMLENLLCEMRRKLQTCDVISPGQSFFRSVKVGNSYCKMEEKIVPGGTRGYSTTTTPFEGIPFSVNANYQIKGGADISIKGNGGSHMSRVLLTDSLGSRVLDQIKEIFFQPRLPTESLPAYHARVASLVMGLPAVKHLLENPPKKASTKFQQRATRTVTTSEAWNKTKSPRLVAALARFQGTTNHKRKAAHGAASQSKKKQKKSRWGPPNASPVDETHTPVDETPTVETPTRVHGLLLPQAGNATAVDGMFETMPTLLPAKVVTPADTVPVSILGTPAVSFIGLDIEAETSSITDSTTNDSSSNHNSSTPNDCTPNNSTERMSGITLTACFQKIGSVLTQLRGGQPVPNTTNTPAGPSEATRNNNETAMAVGSPEVVEVPAEGPPDTVVVPDVDVQPDDSVDGNSLDEIKEVRTSPRNLPKFTDTDGLVKTLNWSTENLERCMQVETHSESRILSCPTATSVRSIVGDGYNTFQGARSILECPSVTLVSTPGLFQEAGLAIDSVRIANGLPGVKKDFVLKEFEFFKLYHDGSTVFYCMTSRFPGSEVYSSPGRCLLCDKLADTLGAKQVSVGQCNVHCFESTEIASRYLCLAIMLTASDSAYKMRFLRRARKWYNRSKQVLNTRGKPSGDSDSEFLVVGFGPPPNARQRDLREKMPYFFVVARSVDVCSHEASRPKYSNDFTLVIPDLTFYRKHYASPSCPRPKKGDLGGALYIRPLHMEASLFERAEAVVGETVADAENSEGADSVSNDSTSATATEQV